MSVSRLVSVLFVAVFTMITANSVAFAAESSISVAAGAAAGSACCNGIITGEP